MKDLSLTQEFYICTINEKGVLPSYDQGPVACLIGAGVLEMQFEGIVSIENKRITVCKELPETMAYLAPLYEVINQGKPVKAEKVVETYTVSFTDKKLRELTDKITDSLKELQVLTPMKSGLRGKERFLPKREAVNSIIDKMRNELLEEEQPSEDVIALTALLDRAGRLKEYLSRHEQRELKQRLEEIRKSEAGNMVKEMVQHIEGMIAVMITTTSILTNI